MRYFTLLVCFLAACFSLLFVYRTTITERIIESRLQAIGSTGIQVTVSGLNNHELRIASLQGRFPQNSPVKSFQLYDLSLHYDLSELLQGKVATLKIDTLQINLGKQEGPSPSPPAPKDIRQYLPGKISIRHLSLSLPEIDGKLMLQTVVHNTIGKPLDIEIGITGKNISPSGWEIASLTGKLFLQTDNGTVISLQENTHIEIEGLRGASAYLQQAHFQVSGELTRSPDKGWLAGPAAIRGETRGLELQGMLVQPSSLLLQIEEQITLSPLLLHHSSLESSDLRLQWQGKSLALKNIHMDVKTVRKGLQLSVLFSHALVPGQIEGHVSHNFIKNRGKAHFAMPFPFNLNGEETNSDQLVNGLKLPFLLHNGLLNCNVNMQWENNTLLFVKSGFEVMHGAGKYKNFTFSGLRIEQELQLVPEIRTMHPGTVFLSELYNGFTVTNIEIHNQIIAATDTPPTLLIDTIEAEILGGKVSSKDIRLDSTSKDFDILVQLQGVALEEVINLNKLQGLTVTGIVDGSIRIQLNNKQLSIPDGELHSRQPGGTISYLPPGGTAALSKLPATAMKALQEFNYNTLIVTPRYEADGMLNIAIHTEGHSPPLNTTRPVHLNLNTEQNLLSLLQSLRYSKNLTDGLEKRLQTRQPKK